MTWMVSRDRGQRRAQMTKRSFQVAGIAAPAETGDQRPRVLVQDLMLVQRAIRHHGDRPRAQADGLIEIRGIIRRPVPVQQRRRQITEAGGYPWFGFGAELHRQAAVRDGFLKIFPPTSGQVQIAQ